MSRVSFQIPEALKERVQRLAQNRGATVDQIIRDALIHELAQSNGDADDRNELCMPQPASEAADYFNGDRVITPEMARRMKCPFPPEPDL